MAKVKWAYPIEELHGKLKGKFGGAQRKAANAKGDRTPFTVNYGTRSTEVGEEEAAKRLKFAAIAKLVGQHRTTLSKKMQDAAGFKAQSTYPTMSTYLWHVCKLEYEASLTQS